ncbi:MAG TPA: MarR family transcriptional regulator [Candidatus Limnocylindrales bacterium]|jgi:DNA-binding MarR family transcriptional regulator
MTSKQLPVQPSSVRIQTVVDNYDRIVRQLTATRSAGIFESTVTMAQLKVLMLLGAKPETRMSELAADLHLSLSTVSGLVEKLVESGLATRRTDDVDRRHVLVALAPYGVTFLDRFQELGKDTLRALLEQLTVNELECVAEAMDVLISAAARITEGENR